MLNGSISPDMQKLILQVAGSDAPSLIIGEFGTGKKLIAAAIHHESKKSDGPLIRINIAGIPQNGIDAELFGCQKGAVNGAHKTQTGKFEQADNGTILLEEIGEMALPLQSKFLSFLQEKKFFRIGGRRPIKVNPRILCTTTKDLHNEVSEGRFNKNLFYYLLTLHIEIPPLRNHKEDIPSLCDVFLNEFSFDHGVQLSLSPIALEVLMEYDYPGNITELRNILERASIIAATPEITVEELPLDLRGIQKKYIPLSINLAENLSFVEKETIKKALRRTSGNKTEAAKLLGISRKNLWQKLKKIK